MPVDYSSQIDALSQESADLQTSINICKKDITDINAESKKTKEENEQRKR